MRDKNDGKGQKIDDCLGRFWSKQHQYCKIVSEISLRTFNGYFVLCWLKGFAKQIGKAIRVFHKHTELAIMTIWFSEALLPENRKSTWDVLKLSFVHAPLQS